MKVHYVSYTDIQGSRFNGFGLSALLLEDGHEPSYSVWKKNSSSPLVASLRSTGMRAALCGVANRLERWLGVQGVLLPGSGYLAKEPRFRDADLVHYQIVHAGGFFNLLSLPRLTKRKPSVWTLHDPWAITGHCVHPESCAGWLSGCRSCPHLDREIPLRRDTAGFMFRLKKATYARSRMDIVVASEWMRDRVRRSPLLRAHPIHVVPFGLDHDSFKPRDRAAARRCLGIAEEAFVVMFRASPWALKGFAGIKEALLGMRPSRPVHLLTVDAVGGLGNLQGAFPCTELGWVDNPVLLSSCYNAADVLLMPSHESFGMMALEAAACAVPVICLEGSAVEEICRPPEGGLAVPEGRPEALAAALETLLGDEDRRRAMGRQAEVLARRYTMAGHVAGLLDVYREVLGRRSA